MSSSSVNFVALNSTSGNDGLADVINRNAAIVPLQQMVGIPKKMVNVLNDDAEIGTILCPQANDSTTAAVQGVSSFPRDNKTLSSVIKQGLVMFEMGYIIKQKRGTLRGWRIMRPPPVGMPL